MLYLALAVLATCLLTIIFKVAAIKGMNGDNITFVNYIVALAVSLYNVVSGGQLSLFSSLGSFKNIAPKTYESTALIIIVCAFVMGAVYLTNFLLQKQSVAQNGAGITSFFKQSGFIGGVAVSVLFFGERLNALKTVGIAITLLALLLVAGDLKNLKVTRPLLLALMLFFSVVIETSNKLYAAFALPEYKPLYLCGIFTLTFILCGAYIIFKTKQSGEHFKLTLGEAAAGTLLGCSNVINGFLQLKALEALDASIVFPSLSGGALLVMTLVSVTIFKEKTNRRHLLAVAIAVLGLVLLNI